MNAPPTPIAVAVVEWQDQFLVGIRSGEQPLAGYAEFPGGRVEPRESAREAAVRECFEETGLRVVVVGEFPAVEHAYDHGSVRLHFFACHPLSPEHSPQPPFRWVRRDELAQLPFPAANRALLARLIRGTECEPGLTVL